MFPARCSLIIKRLQVTEMMKTAKQFEPDTQIDGAIGDLEKVLNEAGSVIKRLGRLKSLLNHEISQLREERDILEIYTEEEAAMLLKLDDTDAARAKKHLANLRRSLGLPHVSFGNKTRYTKQQLKEICSILESNANAKVSLRRVA